MSETTIALDQDLHRLMAIKHIVVLMMENRSFDHMLGYLKTNGLPDVEGLTGSESNPDDHGVEIPVFALPPDATAFHRPGEPYDDSLDPKHGPTSVAEQLRDGNRGFVRNFIRERQPPNEWRSLPMGYFTAVHLPVYDFLAREFCVCDAWHSSVPADTWPNRLYALAARTGPRQRYKPALWQKLLAAIGLSKVVHEITNAPIYDVRAFTHQLRDEQWRWYSYGPATLRAADAFYRKLEHVERKNFAFVNRKEMNWKRLFEEAVDLQDSFFDDATKTGEHGLREVSWVDPNFFDMRVFDSTSNDDHPPSDVLAGQQLVLELYHALANSPDWQETLFVVTYDEHGGFFDHVAPPEVDDDPHFSTYGVRVPALVIGPRVRRGVCHQFFDHTSLMKTILLRFADDPEAAVRAMGSRVERAAHFGVVLEDEPRTDLADHGDLLDELDRWRAEARAARRAIAPGQAALEADGAGRNWQPTDLQREFALFSAVMEQEGLPLDQP